MLPFPCSSGESGGLDLKSENVFLLCALQCQSTHCNLPKVAAIYAIKHVFNIPEPHCVCVFLAHSLALSHSLSACLYCCMSIYVSVCVYASSKWKWSLQSSSPFPLHRRIISPPLRQGGQEVGVYIGLLYPKKQPWVEKLKCSCGVFFLFLFWLLQFASASAVSHPPHQLSHPWLLSQPTFWGGVGWPGTNERPSVQQQ